MVNHVSAIVPGGGVILRALLQIAKNTPIAKLIWIIQNHLAIRNMGRSMKAARFVGEGRDLEIVSLARPFPSSSEVLVRVRAVAICGSDLHILQGHTPTAFTPITLGHEMAGTIESIGAGVEEDLSVGDRVFINPIVGCGHCRFCKAGQANFCAERKIIGIHCDGAMAEYVVAPAGNVVPIAPSVDFAAIAMIESAATANQALRTIEAGKGESIVVIGAGGLGSQAIRIAVARGCKVFAVDKDPVARERCIADGAAGAFDPSESDLKTMLLKAAGRPDGIDGVIDCVAVDPTFNLALNLLRLNGHCAIIGISDQPLTLTPPSHFMRRALRVSAIYAYTSEDIRQVAQGLIQGRLDLGASVGMRLPLDRVNEGMRAFADRSRSLVRVVIEP